MYNTKSRRKNRNIMPTVYAERPKCNNDTYHTTDTPWTKRKIYTPDVLGLHEEINDFYEFMYATPEEAELRLHVVKHITLVVHSLWPEARLEVFGSYRTGLYLPISDIDLVIFGQWKCLPLNALSEALQRYGIKKKDIFIISNTSVPIVRFRHTPTNIKVDISFNQKNGVESAKLIKRYIKTYPVLPKLVYILKQFLVNRDLNEVFSGGMRSYCLMLLVVSFLQGYHKPEELLSTNLGTLLIEFFELYGVNFNYKNICICFKNGEGFFKPGSFTVNDPLTENNDLSSGTHLLSHIQPAFEYAFHMLHAAVTNSEVSQGSNTSILKQIIYVDDETLRERQWIKQNCLKIINTIKSLSS